MLAAKIAFLRQLRRVVIVGHHLNGPKGTGDDAVFTADAQRLCKLNAVVRHAQRLVYAQGLDLQDPEAATPIGMGCKVCERSACPQRAFPFTGKALRVDADESSFVPYGQ